MSRSDIPRAELVAYAVEMITDALNEGIVDPVAMIECLQFATKPTLLATLRSLALADEKTQREMLDLVRRLSKPDQSLN